MQIVRLSTARLKIKQIPCHFSSNESVFTYILHQLSVSWQIIPLKFSSWSITLWTKRDHQITNFQISECFNEFLMPVLKPKGHSLFKFCITVQCHERWLLCIFFISNLYTLDKKSPPKWIFHTFGYLGEKSPNLLCHIWKYKSVFLQNLHRSSVSWEITLLYFFFVETVHDLDKRSPSKCKISDFWLLTFLTFDCFCWKYIKIFTKKVQRSYVSLP